MGKKKSDKREPVFLVCSETGDRNYTVLKKPKAPKLELKKYDPVARKHVVFKETKLK